MKLGSSYCLHLTGIIFGPWLEFNEIPIRPQTFLVHFLGFYIVTALELKNILQVYHHSCKGNLMFKVDGFDIVGSKVWNMMNYGLISHYS